MGEFEGEDANDEAQSWTVDEEAEAGEAMRDRAGCGARGGFEEVQGGPEDTDAKEAQEDRGPDRW
jgi:hypothetical protein